MDILDNLYFIAGIALAGGFSHCIGMCGGIVVAYTTAKGEALSRWQRLSGHLLYNLGRTTTYVAMGALLALLGIAFRLDRTLHGIFFVAVALLMVVIGLQFLGVGRIPLLWDPASSGVFQQTFRRFTRSPSLWSYFGLGLLNGLLPCGFVYFFAAMAAASGSPLQGALIMGVFGLCTIPPMYLLAISIDFFKRYQGLRRLLNTLAGLSILFFAAVFLYKAARLTGVFPVT